MSSFPTNAPLEAAIVAAPEDDGARLAYADWLEEHGDLDRADFIRTQCRLACLSPAEPHWVDLTERQTELAARLKARFADLKPPAPEGFYFGFDIVGEHHEPFRRGFPYFIACQVEGHTWTPKVMARGGTDLGRLVARTTVRALHLYSIPPDRLAELLAVPAAVKLTGLAFGLHSTSAAWEQEHVTAYRVIATSPALRGVRQLGLHNFIPPEGVAALAKADSLQAIRRLTIRGLNAPPATLAKFTTAAWFDRLQHLCLHLRDAAGATPVTAGLGELPDLHTLDLPESAHQAINELATGSFPSLARLMFAGLLDWQTATVLAAAKFPRLAVFAAGGREMKNDALSELLRADWFAQLRVLNLTENRIGDRGVMSLVNHPVAKGLRILRFGDNAFGKSGLAALAKPGAFPELTTLDLHSCLKRKAVAADTVAFLSALQLPRLRHLDLRGWPLGDAGAKMLAESPAFAGLTRLNLSRCGIGDAGAKALFASRHLQQLVELRLNDNLIRTGADAVADPAVMPRLGECRLCGNKIPKSMAAKLKGKGRSVLV
jgi:uncharacterized protein (TIGR02996 family)